MNQSDESCVLNVSRVWVNTEKARVKRLIRLVYLPTLYERRAVASGLHFALWLIVKEFQETFFPEPGYVRLIPYHRLLLFLTHDLNSILRIRKPTVLSEQKQSR